MLSIRNVSKKYVTGTLVQTALDGVSLNLRDSEFVAVLGPSGSGKTTLLNVIGGLDRYDSGDLVINGISTKQYHDRDWDSYRNHAIGFVFQSYNLIPHQTVLANVELALTISGISKAERRRRATKALEEVGLGDQLHKKPAQMSGGQMQRVAIARALVNDPEILLADEPTGALDTETGIQVMELLKKVAEKRLVVMVTHNPELAEAYATRIVSLKDGKITGDTNPYEADETSVDAHHENMGKSSMSFKTALTLSFNNLRTKKARTILTAFAGSIGIIGIAMILSLSTGVNTYISDVQKSTMTSYPITVDAQTLDLASVMQNTNLYSISEEMTHGTDGVWSNPASFHMASGFTTSFTENNLTAFKEYLDNPESEIHEYVGANGIVYSYNTEFDVYTVDPNGEFLNTDGSTLNPQYSSMTSMMPEQTAAMMGSFSNFQQLIPGKDGALISTSITDSYELVHGSWPDNYDEAVLVLNKNYEVDANTLYQLGYLEAEEYRTTMAKIAKGEEIDLAPVKLSYEDITSKEFMLLPVSDTYQRTSDGNFRKIEETSLEFKTLTDSSLKLKISGVIRPKDDTEALFITSAVGYTSALSDYLIEYSNNSEIVKAQLENPNVNVLSGLAFAPSDDAAKIADAKNFFVNCNISEKAKMFLEITAMMQSSDAGAMYSQMGEAELAAAFDEFIKSADDNTLITMYNAYISTGTYEDNLAAFGYVSKDAPSSISIYADSFESKDMIGECIEKYNEGVLEADKITYTDYVGLLMSSVTTIVDVISYVLIAFVSVSLIVSSIMIGIITYISVLERTKEIGILRAIGASKKNISQVFNAETFIIGLCSGIIGIGVTLLLILPINAIIHALSGIDTINAILPWKGALFLVILSMLLTVISGLIPSKKAAKKDPVAALRSE